MLVELSLKVNNEFVGSKSYRCGDMFILTPLVRILDEFSGSVLDWAARTPQASLDPVETVKFLDRNKDYRSPEVYRSLLQAAENKNTLLANEVYRLKTEMKLFKRGDEFRLVKRRLKIMKRLASRLARGLDLETPESGTNTKRYYRVNVPSSWGGEYSKISYGKDQNEAIRRFRHYYKETNPWIYVQEIKNPRLK